MKKIIDIHSHILPAVDDGCKTEHEALQMLKMYEEQDVEAVICTPHYGPCAKRGANVESAFEWIKATESPVKLYLGNEILYTRHTLRDVLSGDARRLAGSDWVLVEFEEWEYFSTPSEILNGCRLLSATLPNVILAHPERYINLQINPGYYEKIVNTGTKLQINAYDICENDNLIVRDTTKILLENNLVSFIGSDAHGASRRAPRLSKGVRWIYDHCPEEYADAIVHDNAAKIIKQGEA